jgi:hypothetical protein
MWWLDKIIDVNTNPMRIIKYYHIDISGIIRVHSKIVKNEDEFLKYYETVKRL